MTAQLIRIPFRPHPHDPGPNAEPTAPKARPAPQSRARQRHTATTVTITPDTPFEALPVSLTPEEASRFLRIGRTQTYAACRNGQLPAVKVGSRFVISKYALARMLGIPVPELGEDVKGPLPADRT